MRSFVSTGLGLLLLLCVDLIADVSVHDQLHLEWSDLIDDPSLKNEWEQAQVIAQNFQVRFLQALDAYSDLLVEAMILEGKSKGLSGLDLDIFAKVDPWNSTHFPISVVVANHPNKLNISSKNNFVWGTKFQSAWIFESNKLPKFLFLAAALNQGKFQHNLELSFTDPQFKSQFPYGRALFSRVQHDWVVRFLTNDGHRFEILRKRIISNSRYKSAFINFEPEVKPHQFGISFIDIEEVHMGLKSHQQSWYKEDLESRIQSESEMILPTYIDQEQIDVLEKIVQQSVSEELKKIRHRVQPVLEEKMSDSMIWKDLNLSWNDLVKWSEVDFEEHQKNESIDQQFELDMSLFLKLRVLYGNTGKVNSTSKGFEFYINKLLEKGLVSRWPSGDLESLRNAMSRRITRDLETILLIDN